MLAKEEEDENSEADNEAQPLAWEAGEESLPEDLAQVLRRFEHHGLQVPVRDLLEECPRWLGLKIRAENNNCRNDSSKAADKNLKATQQKIIGLLRIYPILHQGLEGSGEEIVQLGQKFFTLLLEIEKFIFNKRKEASIPHSIQPNEPQLFNVEDLKVEAQALKLNRAGMCNYTSFPYLEPPRSYFQTAPGYYKQRYKPAFKAYGKGFGGFGGFGGKGGYKPTYKPFKGKGKGKAPCPSPSFKSSSKIKSSLKSMPSGQSHSACPTDLASRTHSGLAFNTQEVSTPRGLLEIKINSKEKRWGNTPLHQRLQKSLGWWSKHASKEVVDIIREGIKPPWANPPKLPIIHHQRGEQNLEQAHKILLDYQQSGSVKLVGEETTCYLIPCLFFKTRKRGQKSGNLFPIVDKMNTHLTPKTLKLDHLQ